MAGRQFASLDAFIASLPELSGEIAGRLKGQNGLFSLRTKQGREMLIALEDGQITLPEHADRSPDCTVEADEHDLVALLNGELSPAKALLFGKVRVRGNKTLLLKLTALV